MSLELGEIYMYIVPNLLSPCRGASVSAVSSEGPPHLPASYDKLTQAQAAINHRHNYNCIQHNLNQVWQNKGLGKSRNRIQSIQDFFNRGKYNIKSFDGGGHIAFVLYYSAHSTALKVHTNSSSPAKCTIRVLFVFPKRI